jgi:hypothetical protein
MRRLLPLAVVVAMLCCAPLVSAAESAEYGLESVGASVSTPQAGGHPELQTTFTMKTDSVGFPFAGTRDLEFVLPPGLLANLSSFPQCTFLQFQTRECPIDSQIGIVSVTAYSLGSFIEPLYYLTRGPDTVARLGYDVQSYPNVVNIRVNSERDYEPVASVEGILSAYPPVEATTTIWGVPADPSHDAQRITPDEAINGEPPPGGGRPSSLPPTPLTVNPTRCGVPLAVSFTAVSYAQPSQPSSLSAPLGPISGCGQIGFAPSLAATPTTHEAASPSGLDVKVTLPQNEAVNGLATSHLRDVEVTFPRGVTIAPGAADGQLACSDEEAGYKSRNPARCPDASKLGSAEIDVPLLERPLQGGLYLRTPLPDDLFRVWLIADDLGLHLALPGELHVDETTGQITSAFFEMPQAPVREAKIHVFGGSHGPLSTPSACGAFDTTWRMTPWSGTPPVSGVAPMTIDRGCETGGFSPKLSAGSVNPLAGKFSSFVTTVMRESREQNISGLKLTLPPGVSAKLAGVPLCKGTAAQSGDCAANSRIGRVTLATGPGPTPLWLPQPGRERIPIFLGGPYEGAPYSLVIRTPAQAGPFDLGTVVTRAAIQINPHTAQATVDTDPLPQILRGVPITYRTIHADLDRPHFVLNPTRCTEMSVDSKLTSIQGATATPSARFQAADCSRLPFKPKLSLSLRGRSTRGGTPAMRAVLEMRSGEANVASAQVTLPHSEFVDNAHLRNVCTRAQFAKASCPRNSVIGHAMAKTPLLEAPLRGPVYLMTGFGHTLPDLFVDLNGKIHVELNAKIDSGKGGGLRSTFKAVPDAPVSKFVLNLMGGKRGLLENSEDVCAHPERATAKFTGQNGKVSLARPTLHIHCHKRPRRR